MYNIDPGELTEQLQLYNRGAPTVGASGQKAINWVHAGTVYAKYVPQRASERFQAAQTQSDNLVRFVIRVGLPITNTWRVTWGGVGYDVTAATPLPGRQWMELICREGVKDGR